MGGTTNCATSKVRLPEFGSVHSMRCRVSQSWASKGWGGMVIPRIGMEVVVEFLEGDPDKPLVTGCVYNGKNRVPYELPQHKTKSVFRSDTHEGSGFNELSFEDRKDEEEILLHAQKDQNLVVRNNRTKRVLNNQVEEIGNNKVIEVTRNHSEVVGGNMDIHVGPTNLGRFINRTLTSIVDKLGDVAKGLGLPAALDPGAGNMTLTVEKHALQTIGLSSMHTVGLSHTSIVGKNSKIAAGDQIKLSAGKAIMLTCGKSAIELHSDGRVIMSGDDISIRGNVRVTVNGKIIYLN